MADLEKVKELLEDLNIPNADSVDVSVIVPVYNSEEFISKCLLSLVKQTLSNIEIIVVNDGSTDDTVKIVELFAQKDSRITLINQENLKQGAARNTGMRAAKGEYIGFVDSDDWVDENYFEKLYIAAKKYDSDIAFATNIRIGNGKTKKRLNITDEIFYTNLQEKFDACKLAKNPCPTNKIYKKELFEKNNITWVEGRYCEDKLFVTQSVYYANGIVSVPDTNYYYFRNPNSTVNNKNKKHLKKIIADKEFARKSVLDFLKQKNAEIRDKEFWAITKKIQIFNVPVIIKKESLHTARYYFLSFIKIFEKAI